MFWQPAAGALAVIDARLLAESMRQRSLAVKQWAHDNDQQLQQINQLTKGNAQLLSTHDLMAQNYRMDHQSSWQNIETMREQSLALLYASKALWDEYGSAQQYYADSLKAQAWESCINTRVCDFNQALQDINELKLNQAIQAYQNATSMSYKIEDQIGALQQLPLEGLNSQSLAATIDVLAKINGSVAVSMADLNQQLAILTKITSQNMAKESQTETLNRAFLEAITSHQSVFQEPVTNQIPN